MGVTSRFSYFPNYAEEIKEDDSFSVTREDIGFDEGDFVIGFAGGMGPAQGIDLVIEAADRLKDDKNLKLLLMGDGTEYNKLKNIVKDKGLTDKVLLPGWIALERLPAYMRICDCMMMCLKDNEVLNITVPAKLQTYMSYAKPVIAFMNGAGAGVIQDARCGVSVQAEDISGLTEAFKRLHSMDKAELQQLGANGKKYCDEVFARGKILDLLEKELFLATGDRN
jgi:glycosyltransferase involved in cell wall biosynthesis